MIVLIYGAHPDDEADAFWLTHLLLSNNHDVYIRSATPGGNGASGVNPQTRLDESFAAATYLNNLHPGTLDFALIGDGISPEEAPARDGRVYGSSTIAGLVTDEIKYTIRPDIIIKPVGKDFFPTSDNWRYHSDHVELSAMIDRGINDATRYRTGEESNGKSGYRVRGIMEYHLPAGCSNHPGVFPLRIPDSVIQDVWPRYAECFKTQHAAMEKLLFFKETFYRERQPFRGYSEQYLCRGTDLSVIGEMFAPAE